MSGVNRRHMLAFGSAGAGALALAIGLPALWPARGFEFTPVARPAGFRRIARSDGISAASVFVGVDAARPRPAPLSTARICDLVFGGHPTGAGRLAIAVFSDFFCPYCRVLDVQVRDLARRDGRVTIIPHEVPLLGVPSQMAARAVIAAAAQGAEEMFRSRLIRTRFVPTPAYLSALAEEAALDVDRFEQDMRSEETTLRIENSTALFRAFGFVGTPALAVGRTLVNGAIGGRELRALMDLELAEDAPAACR